MNKPNRKPKRTAAKRRTGALTVASQLQGKLGVRGYGRLLDKLGQATKKKAA